MNKAGSGPEETVDFFGFRNAFQLTYAEMAALSGFDDCGMRW